MSSQIKVVVVGIVKNCSKSLGPSILSISQALDPIPVNNWHFVESDSRDGTLKSLNYLRGRISGFTFDSLGSLSREIPERLERLAFCRERVRLWLATIEEKPDVVVVADMDGVATSLLQGELSRAFANHFRDFDVLTANTFGRYYDILALRRPGLVEQDYRETEEALLQSGENPFGAKYLALVQHQEKISPSNPPIAVRSAFGGLAAYKYECMTAASYISSNPEVCEHVTFHEKLVTQGFKIAIVPTLRIHGDRRHTIFSNPILKPLWSFARRLPHFLAWPLSRTLKFQVGKI